MAEENRVSEDTAPAAQPTTQAHPAKNETFLPLIFGGAVACALGFFAGQIDAIEQRLGLGEDSELAMRVDSQAEALDTQAEHIAALTTRLEAAEEIEIPEVDLSAVTSAIEGQTVTIEALAARLSELEKRPMTEGLSEEAVAAYEAELQRLQASVETQRSEIEALLDEARMSEDAAEEQARIALARAAMSQIITAVESGAPFSDALADLQANGEADVPAILAETAEAGVPTLANLRETFPENARAALAAVRAGSSGGSVTGFLQKQLGVRSVAPREGNDPDAVLSRAEAAVRDARLGDALAELSELPEPARAAMADWIALAETRHAALVAADDLMTALATN